ncbi:MAG TPA: DUF1232 domain-containing protein [Anaerolineae bacterium]|nr:DUF1232 domain-containing protein [Anaerolineae bacterium]HQI87012.1 DUF1232 domain-containing protein [Anaerolineae bacterium]
MAGNELEKAKPGDQLGFLLKPLSLRGFPTWVVYLASLVGLAYILNPTAGLIELLPDNLPIVGNLDEGVAFTLLWYGLVEFFEGRKFRPTR